MPATTSSQQPFVLSSIDLCAGSRPSPTSTTDINKGSKETHTQDETECDEMLCRMLCDQAGTTPSLLLQLEGRRCGHSQDRNGHHPWVIELCYPATGMRVLFALRAIDTNQAQRQMVIDDASAAAISANLIRPGWTDHIVRRASPILQGETVYYSFTLERTSSLALMANSRWNLVGLLPTPLDVPFIWQDVVKQLDAWHAWLDQHVHH